MAFIRYDCTALDILYRYSLGFRPAHYLSRNRVQLIWKNQTQMRIYQIHIIKIEIKAKQRKPDACHNIIGTLAPSQALHWSKTLQYRSWTFESLLPSIFRKASWNLINTFLGRHCYSFVTWSGRRKQDDRRDIFQFFTNTCPLECTHQSKKIQSVPWANQNYKVDEDWYLSDCWVRRRFQMSHM